MIKDGTGQGYLARVGPKNRIDMNSRSSNRIYYASRDDNSAYAVTWEHTQAVGGATEGVGYLTYTGDNTLVIGKVRVSSEEPTGGMTKFGFWVNPTTLAGGAAKTPVNMNLGSALTSEVTSIHNNDGTAVTITGGSSVNTIRMCGPYSMLVVLDNALILTKGTTFAIKSAAVTLGTKTRATVLYFEE